MKAQLNLHSEWVNSTFKSLTMDEKIGQLLVPAFNPKNSEKDIDESLKDIQPGGVFLFAAGTEEYRKTLDKFRRKCRIPILVSTDLESGAGGMIKGKTLFPNILALAATDSEEYAYEMGRAAALEGRETGVHWTFAPVADINAHPFNPIANTRSMGDDPDRIIRLGKALVRGMQENGLIATAKHFPGDGFDDRDQHLCTSVNNLSKARWMKLSGRVFKALIDEGVQTIMVGHIAMPAFDGGKDVSWQDLPPAIISKNIVTGVLRKKLGFEGLIITDAIGMAGAIAYEGTDLIVPKSIRAGCEMILFADPVNHFHAIKKAVDSGFIPPDMIEAAVRRILALKEKNGLNGKEQPVTITTEVRENIKKTSRSIAESCLTLVRDDKKVLPLKLAKGSRIFSLQLRSESWFHVTELENALKEQGYVIDHFDETNMDAFPPGYREVAGQYSAVLVSFMYGANYGTNSIRPSGPLLRKFWQLCTPAHSMQVVISFGSPFIMYDFPHLTTYINAYSPDVMTQRACARLLLGEITARGKSPVDLMRPFKMRKPILDVIG